MNLPRAYIVLLVIAITHVSPLGNFSISAKPQPGDFRYSGMHDTGILDEPREGGPVALLVHTVLQAKEYNDAYLTAVIEAEKAESLCTDSESYDSTTKKMKVSKT